MSATVLPSGSPSASTPEYERKLRIERQEQLKPKTEKMKTSAYGLSKHKAQYAEYKAKIERFGRENELLKNQLALQLSHQQHVINSHQNQNALATAIAQAQRMPAKKSFCSSCAGAGAVSRSKAIKHSGVTRNTTPARGAKALAAPGFVTFLVFELVATKFFGTAGVISLAAITAVLAGVSVLTAVTRKRRTGARQTSSWRAVVGVAPGAPLEPVEGFELWLPDRIQEERDGCEQVFFTARRCRWEAGGWKQIQPREDVKLPADLQMVWPLDTDTVTLVEGWAEFVQALLELNAAQMEGAYGAKPVEVVPERLPQVAELLELPAPLPASTSQAGLKLKNATARK